MKISVTLQPVTSEDQDFLLQVYSSTRAQEMSMVPWNDAQREAFLRMQFAAQQQDYISRFPDGRHSIILADDVKVGRIYLAERDSELKILDVTVLPQHQRKGIGTSVLNELREAALLSGKRVTIYVESFNPSLQFFEDIGFQKIEENGFQFLLEWRPADAQ